MLKKSYLIPEVNCELLSCADFIFNISTGGATAPGLDEDKDLNIIF